MSTSNPGTRKLAAILFADIVGYTAMMQADEGRAISRLQRYKEVLGKEVEAYGGEILKSYGDGSLCLFSSVLSAVNCAKAIQESLQTGQIVPLRIGIHLGDIMYRADDIYGDALNIASRIESMGISGSILVSKDVFKKVRNQANLKFKSLGHFELKNVSDPLEIYALANPGLAVPEPNEVGGKVKRLSSPQHYKWAKWSAVLITVILALLFSQTNYFKSLIGSKQSNLADRGAVAVLNFENNTQNLELDLLGKMVSNRIIHGITENDIAKVITSETIDDYNKIGRASVSPQSLNSFLSSKFGVKEVIKGNIYQEGDSLLFDCVLSNAETEEVIRGIKTIKCAADQPMKGIEALKQTVLGFLALSKDMQLNLSLETSPPKYEAYKQLLLSKEKGMFDDPMELEHLNRAIAIDSTYFEPQVLRLSYYYNLDEFAAADSLLGKINIANGKADKRQQNLLNFYSALLKGNNDLSFKYMNNEYVLSPFHLGSNMTNMVLAVQFNNLLDLAEDMYKVIPIDAIDLSSCSDCQSRLYVKIYMDIESGQLDDAIENARMLIKSSGSDFSGGLLTRALVQTERWSELDDYIISYRNRDPNIDLLPYYFAAAKECVTEGKTSQASIYLNKAEQEFGADSNIGRIGDVRYMQGNINEAKSVFEKILADDPSNLKALSYLGGLYLLENDEVRSNEMIARIEEQRAPYQYGEIDYWLGRSFAIGGQKENAISKLKASVAQGYRYGFQDFQHDFIFAKIKDLPAFKELLTYWH